MDSYYESDENDSDRDFPVPPGQEEADLDNVQMSAAELSDAEDDEPAFATEDDMDLERQIAALDDQRRQLEKARTRRRRQVNAGRGLDLGSPGTDNDPSEDYKSSRQSLEAEKDVDITSNKRGVSRKAPKPSSKVHKRRKRKVPSVSAPKKHETRAPQHDDGPILPPLDAPAPIDQPVVLESHDDLERARLARLERKKKQKSRTDKKKPIVVRAPTAKDAAKKLAKLNSLSTAPPTPGNFSTQPPMQPVRARWHEMQLDERLFFISAGCEERWQILQSLGYSQQQIASATSNSLGQKTREPRRGFMTDVRHLELVDPEKKESELTKEEKRVRLEAICRTFVDVVKKHWGIEAPLVQAHRIILKKLNKDEMFLKWLTLSDDQAKNEAMRPYSKRADALAQEVAVARKTQRQRKAANIPLGNKEIDYDAPWAFIDPQHTIDPDALVSDGEEA